MDQHDIDAIREDQDQDRHQGGADAAHTQNVGIFLGGPDAQQEEASDEEKAVRRLSGLFSTPRPLLTPKPTIAVIIP